MQVILFGPIAAIAAITGFMIGVTSRGWESVDKVGILKSRMLRIGEDDGVVFIQ